MAVECVCISAIVALCSFKFSPRRLAVECKRIPANAALGPRQKIRTYIDGPMHAGTYSLAHMTSTLCDTHTYILTASARSCGLTVCCPLSFVWQPCAAPAAVHSCSGLQYRFCVAQYIAGCLFMSIYTILEDRVLQGAPPHSYDGARCAERAPCPKTLMWLGL